MPRRRLGEIAIRNTGDDPFAPKSKGDVRHEAWFDSAPADAGATLTTNG
ncbi:hypothetical protein [Anaeromyxobacter oryzisoli]|nr:hypothetical protein [Anaeromyxobacter sp. SG63]